MITGTEGPECEKKCDCENCVRSNNAKRAIEYLMRRNKTKLAEAVYVAAQDAEKYHKLCVDFMKGNVKEVKPIISHTDTIQ